MSENEWEYERTPSNMCGVTMSAGVEGNAVAEVMGEKEGVAIADASGGDYNVAFGGDYIFPFVS